MENNPKSPPPKPSGLSAFWAELKRRKVMRVAITYIIVAWAVIQVAVNTFPSLLIPGWALSFVVMCVILGFPVALVLAWAFELTPDGIKKNKVARQENVGTEESEAQSKKRNWLAIGFAAALPTFIFGSLALTFYLRSGGSNSAPSAPGSTISESVKSIAVLPLANFSSDPENAFFADGIHDEILTNLGNLSELLVIARTSVLQYRDTVKPIHQIGDELGVRYLLEGSVQRDQNKAAITLQLIDAETGGHLWARTYDHVLDDVMSIRAAVARDVAHELQAVLLPNEIAQIEQRPTANQEAYDYYLLAKRKRGDDSMLLLEGATELDPDYYDAWYELAHARVFKYRFATRRSDPDLLEQSNRALAKVIQLSPESGRTLYLQAQFAYLAEGDIEKALSIGLKAKSLRVGGADVGERYLQLGRLVEAKYHTEESLRTDPLNRSLHQRLYRILLYMGDWDGARSVLEKMAELFGASNVFSGTYDLREQHDFLRYGDLEKYVASRLEALPSVSREDARIWEALAVRDHRKAIKAIEDYRTKWFYLIGPPSPNYDKGVFIAPQPLLAALNWYALDEKEKWLQSASQALAFLVPTSTKSALKEPTGFSLQAIAYALEGNSEKVDSLVPYIRDLTNTSYNHYRYYVLCEIYLAMAYVILGDDDKAIETLEAASKLDNPIFLNRELNIWFIFDRLRGNPRFDALIK